MSEKQKITLAVFDWAGTTVDYGSSAPATVFDRIFSQEGIHFTRSEINEPMGMEKREHIRTLLQTETGTAQWQQTHHMMWTEADVNRLYHNFEATLYEVVAEYSKLIAGVVETITILREQGLKIGSTTGYTDQMMQQVTPGAAAAGYQPDCLITPDQTGLSRPTPFMLFECMRQLEVYPPCTVVKVGDTVMDILEGKNAGAWTIGIITGSNALGLTEEEYRAMEQTVLEQKKNIVKKKYLTAGADLVIDQIADLPQAIALLNVRLTEEA